MQVIVVSFVALKVCMKNIARLSDKVMLNIPLCIYSINIILHFQVNKFK